MQKDALLHFSSDSLPEVPSDESCRAVQFVSASRIKNRLKPLELCDAFLFLPRTNLTRNPVNSAQSGWTVLLSMLDALKNSSKDSQIDLIAAVHDDLLHLVFGIAKPFAVCSLEPP